PPNHSRTAPTTSATPVTVLTSARTNRSAARPSDASERAVVATFAPAAARRPTIASPTPCVPPVTRARLPASSVGSTEKRIPDDIGFALADMLASSRQEVAPEACSENTVNAGCCIKYDYTMRDDLSVLRALFRVAQKRSFR